MKTFGIIGVAGYIAKKHLQAIKDTQNSLVCALDKNDSVGILDSYFPEADFFIEFERFDRHINKLKRKQQGLDFISICSPNYLHDSHIRFALHNGANAICEKPLVLNPWNIDSLSDIEAESGKKVYNILQLRLHPSILKLKAKVQNELQNNPNKVYDITLTYLTSRGKWYFVSWKGDESKSGGIATNIGVHFFDMLCFIFGTPKKSSVHTSKPDCIGGYLELKHARVRWFLSINPAHIPPNITDKKTYRSIIIDNEEIEFSDGFTDLHTKSYQDILDGKGFGLEDARMCIQIIHDIRNTQPIGLVGDYHPLCQKVLA
ncbi:Gfo/Idh/MocA family oxidoreductase [Helicobacter sp. 11S02596-1]|uniref:Gfo/Idh/MocA family oxidoreductase n=1 Tax=Helicobacter sp. 11S02596-1 TaxID=1476194 RepID=UPI000BA574B5|nr:Gfo/Idh/MocA family oxidoreductase [Helicobacter sp. 11S02596-1]PAF45204.1 oxidoreductase [Helicobacter sp. 11S02596-1]